MISNHFTLKSIVILLVIGLLSSCSEDPGTLSISGDNATAARGQKATLNYTLNAEDGIKSASASVNGNTQSIAINGEPTTQRGTLSFDIPGNAVMGTKYNATIQMTDKSDQNTKKELVIEVGPLISAPSTYAFTRNGSSTVSYSGQNDRLNQLAEIKNYLKKGDKGEAISAQVLKDAYANTGGDGNGFFSFSSSKQLKNKSFQPDVDAGLMSKIFDSAEAASKSGKMAVNGTAGLITRESKGKTVLVDANGREYTQLVEKGLMGSVLYNQIYNTYFTEGRTGDNVENTALRDGKNYTDMEHHWDEAFGYWNPPLDFSSNWPSERGKEDRFWSHYSNTVDPFIGTNDKIMKAFIEGRTAIVNNDLATKTAKRTEVMEQLDIVAAAVGVHYINSTLSALNQGHQGDAFHTLSEAWAFVNALRYYPNRKLSLEQIATIMESDFGAEGNFWNVTAEGLNKAKSTIVAAYPVLESSKDQL